MHGTAWTNGKKAPITGYVRLSAISSRHSISIHSDTPVFRNEMESTELCITEQFACGTLIVFKKLSRTPRYELQLAQLGVTELVSREVVTMRYARKHTRNPIHEVGSSVDHFS